MLVETGRHDRDGAGTHFLDIAPGDPRLLVDAGRQDQFIGRLAAEQTIKDLAVAGRHRDRLEAAHEAGTGKNDRLQKVAIGSNRADAREVGADVSPPVADGMTGEAGCLFTVEDKLTASDVARRQGRHELLEPGFLPGRVDVELLA